VSTPVSATAEVPLISGGPLAEPEAPHKWRVAVRSYLRHPAGMVGLALTLLIVVAGLLADVISPGDPFRTVADPLLEPSGSHGTSSMRRSTGRGRRWWSSWG
jgi:hypothetical protein